MWGTMCAVVYSSIANSCRLRNLEVNLNNYENLGQVREQLWGLSHHLFCRSPRGSSLLFSPLCNNKTLLPMSACRSEDSFKLQKLLCLNRCFERRWLSSVFKRAQIQMFGISRPHEAWGRPHPDMSNNTWSFLSFHTVLQCTSEVPTLFAFSRYGSRGQSKKKDTFWVGRITETNYVCTASFTAPQCTINIISSDGLHFYVFLYGCIILLSSLCWHHISFLYCFFLNTPII